MSDIRFHVLSPDLAYAFMTRSTLGLLPAIFRKFLTNKWPLIDARISFPFNTFRTNTLKHSGVIFVLLIKKNDKMPKAKDSNKNQLLVF